MLPDEFFGRWVQVEGRVEIVSLPAAMERLVDYYRRVSGEQEDTKENDLEAARRCPPSGNTFVPTGLHQTR